MKETLNLELPPLTIISCVVILVVASIFAIIIWRNKSDLGKRKHMMDQFPSIVSTLGVLGTFLGITLGLVYFNTTDIEGSIPDLLDGLKTAFFTSLTGMICSLLLTWMLNTLIDKEEKVSDAVSAANIVVKAVKSIEETYKNTSAKMSTMYGNMADFVNSIDVKVSNVNTSLSLIDKKVHNVNTSLSSIGQNVVNVNARMANVENKLSSLDSQVDGIGTHMRAVDVNVANVDRIMQTMPKQVNNVEDKVQAVQASVDNFNTVVADSYGRIENRMEECHQEVKDELLSLDGQMKVLVKLVPNEVRLIQESMKSTNSLLSEKFDEFTELLKKSNTEALVAVMKNVTEEFNKQMSELINKLVQENFEQLNKSVERLNKWQIDNKEMIAELTNRYKQMTVAFGETSNTLQKVGGETAALVGNESKLSQLVKVLGKVMVDDERFVNITENLTASATLTKDMMVKFHDEVTVLNTWVNKQRNFVEAVDVLITRLDEINKINDYGEEFWKETRKGMNESVNIIRNGVKVLQEGIEDLDAHFYDCLNKTLANLDSCIAAFVPTKRKE